MAKGFVSELVAPGPSSVTRCGVLAPDVRARCGSPPMLYTYLTTLSPDRDAGTEETTDNHMLLIYEMILYLMVRRLDHRHRAKGGTPTPL